MGVSGRSLTVYTGLMVAVAIAIWRHAEAVFSPLPTILPELGRPYAVDLSGRQPAIDLEFDGKSRYELIVSSLGDGLQAYAVRLEAQPRRCVESFPAIRIERLAPRTTRLASRTPNPPIARTIHERGASERRFFLHVTADRLDDERGYVPVTATLAGEGERVRVYVDRQTSPGELASGLIDEMIRLFDAEIIRRSREIVGEHADVDGDGKLAIFVTPWLGKLRGGMTSLHGMVRSSDFQDGIDAPFGNHADVIYINAALRPGLALKTLLAHEYTHAVCFSRRLVADVEGTTLPVEEDWLNESIAHVAEKLHGGDWSNLDRRIAAFLAAPQSAPLVVRDYYRAGLWRDPGCRGATFLFLRFCVDHFGEQLLRDLMNGPLAGKANLESATRMRFAELLRHWAIALSEGTSAALPLDGKMRDGSPTGISRIPWTVESGPCEFDLSGTATAFIDLTNFGPKEAVRVNIHAAPTARLQLTVIRRAR
jgi:hypothetical protein